jgi:hypothetical protein
MAANVSAAQGAAARAAAVADNIATAARPTTVLGRTAAQAANAIRAVVKNPAVQLAGLGLTIGAPIYDVLTTKKREEQDAASDALVNAAVAKAQAEAAAEKAQMDIDNAKTKKENDDAIKAANDATAEQLAAAARMNKAIEDMQKDYEKWKSGSMGSSTADILNVLNGTATSVPTAPPIFVGTYGDPSTRMDITPSLPTRIPVPPSIPIRPVIDYAAPAPPAPAPTRRGRQGGMSLQTQYFFTPEEKANYLKIDKTQGPYEAKRYLDALIEQKSRPSDPLRKPLPPPVKKPVAPKPPSFLGPIISQLPAPYKPPPPTMKEKAEAMLRRRRGGLVLPKVVTRLDDRRGGAKKAESEILKLLTGM